MSFKDTWRPRVDGIDVNDSSAVNEIAKQVIENEEAIETIKKGYDYYIHINELEQKKGYIAFDLLSGTVTEILCEFLDYQEGTVVSLFRILCGDSIYHSHKLTADIGETLPSHYYSVLGSAGTETWYIPFEFIPYEKENFKLYAKGVVNSITNDLNARFVESLPIGVVDIEPVRYATQEDIGDIDTALDELHAYAQNIIGGNS